jgi:hypothetical protein
MILISEATAIYSNSIEADKKYKPFHPNTLPRR